VRALVGIAVGAVLWVGCGAGDASSCRIDTLAASVENGQTPEVCGAFSLDADAGFDDASMMAAHDCVLQAVAAGRAFTLFYDVYDAKQHLRGAFTGAVSSGKLQLAAWAYVGDREGGSGDSRPQVTEESCGSVVDAGCTPQAGKPCLSCQSAGAPRTLCSF
jgi:hypothetical protein